MKTRLFSILALLLVAATGAMAQTTYTVSVKQGTEDAEKWEANPNPATAGQTVTVTYSGSKKVKSVTAVKKAAAAGVALDNTTTAWTDGNSFAVPVGGLTYSDAITVSGNVTLVLTAGETLTLNKGISLASGATLTIEGTGTMNINGTDNNTSSTVAGSGTLVLTSGTLTAKGGNGQSLNTSDDYVSGGSGGVAINGSVTVNGGTLTATGGNGGNLNVTISGGVDYTHGGNGGAAISGNVIVNSGGTLTATNGSNGSYTGYTSGSGCSAGTGSKAVAGTVTNNGGTVN